METSDPVFDWSSWETAFIDTSEVEVTNMRAYKAANPWLEGTEGKWIEHEGQLIKITEPYALRSDERARGQARTFICTIAIDADGNEIILNQQDTFDPD